MNKTKSNKTRYRVTVEILPNKGDPKRFDHIFCTDDYKTYLKYYESRVKRMWSNEGYSISVVFYDLEER